MKTIINKGYEKFTATCDKCNCTFEYELGDVVHKGLGVYYVDCLECGYDSDHLENVRRMRKTDAFIAGFHKD